MDRTDKKILTLLQNDARLSNQALADEVSLSPSPCLRRVNLLEENGVIQKYVALLNPEALGIHLTVFTSVGLDKHTPTFMRQFETAIKKIPEVMECYLVTGQRDDFVLKIVVSSMEHYQKILPYLFQSLNDPTEGVRTECLYALEAFCEHLGLLNIFCF